MTETPSDWCSLDLALEVTPPVRRPGIGLKLREPIFLRQVVEQFAGQARYVKRDVTGDKLPETFCNFFVRDVLRALGVDIPRMRAHEWGPWLAKSPHWSTVPPWVAIALAQSGFPVVAWQVKNIPTGHVALLVPAKNDFDIGKVWIAQAGRENFVYGELAAGFGQYEVKFFAHP